MTVKSRQAENSASTRNAMLKVARKLFAERGYAETATEEVVHRARVTRGALYHHFHDKRDLFKAVLHEEERRLAEAITAVAVAQPDPWKSLQAANEAFLDACLDPAVQQIILIDAPAVLGWEGYREIDNSYFLAGLKATIEAAIQEKIIPALPVEPAAQMIMGALHEGALLITHSDDEARTRREVSEVVKRLLKGVSG
jgi:AcrR family transcriptional regulator